MLFRGTWSEQKTRTELDLSFPKEMQRRHESKDGDASNNRHVIAQIPKL
jgi:hypothetical protein